MNKTHIRLLYPFASTSVPAVSDKDLLIATPEWAGIAEFKSTLAGIYQTNKATGSPYVLALCAADDSLFLIRDDAATTLDDALLFWKKTQSNEDFAVEKLIKAATDVILDVNAAGGIIVCDGSSVMQGDPEWTDLCSTVEYVESALSGLVPGIQLVREEFNGSVDDYLDERE